MYDITLDVTARTTSAAVSSVVHVVQAIDFTTAVLALAAVAAVMVITAVVSTYAEAHARRVTTRRYRVDAPVGDHDDAVGAVTAVILVVVVVVAAMLIGVPMGL